MEDTLPTEFGPEMVTVPSDVIYDACKAVMNGLEYVHDCLATHDTNLGRTTRKNKIYAEMMETDIARMEATLADLKEIKVNP